VKKDLFSENDAVRLKAIETVKSWPTAKRKALVSGLMDSLKAQDSKVVDRAAQALVATGDAGVDSVSSLLLDEDVFVRLTAASILGRIGPPAKPALPLLVKGLKDAHPLVREESAGAIGKIGGNDPLALSALIEAMSDENAEVREKVTEALTQLGFKQPAGKYAVPSN
jgi:HEAT repeat protein